MNVQTSEGCFYERIDRRLSDIVDTIEIGKDTTLTAIDDFSINRFELAVRSKFASSGQKTANVMQN